MVAGNPLVSVIVCAHNAEQFITDALRSLQEQTFNDFEVLIIDDGSTDHTARLAAQFEKADNRFKAYQEPHEGLTISLNKGIRRCRGAFITRLDADDVCEPHRLEMLVEILKNRTVDVVCSRARIHGSTRVTPRWTTMKFRHLLVPFRNPYIGASFMFRSGCIREIGGYNSEFYYAQDYNLTFELYRRRIKIKYLSEPLYILRRHSEAISARNLSDQVKYFKITKRLWRRHLAGSAMR